MNGKQKPVFYWLLLGCALVGLMVIVGGITRLTQSGLSIVEWDLVMGSIPPLSEESWKHAFEKYQTSPEFTIVNPDFQLQDFKKIFWWEYIHRLLGRLIGIAFLVPFVVFLFQRRINQNLLPKLLIIFMLGAFQGFLGWYMVKSGLINNPYVSHYRLAAHFVTALLTFGFTLWVALDILTKRPVSINISWSRLSSWLYVGLAFLVIQLTYGAFVAGLKAGMYYNTWPLMNGSLVPKEVSDSIGRAGIASLLDNITTVQFIHRWVAIILFASVFRIWLKTRLEGDAVLRKSSNYLLIFTSLQVFTGIFTLVLKIPILMAVLHQFGAVALITCFVILLHRAHLFKN